MVNFFRHVNTIPAQENCLSPRRFNVQLFKGSCPIPCREGLLFGSFFALLTRGGPDVNSESIRKVRDSVFHCSLLTRVSHLAFIDRRQVKPRRLGFRFSLPALPHLDDQGQRLPPRERSGSKTQVVQAQRAGAGGIFADTVVEIPITVPIPSTDSTSSFLQASTTSNTPKYFVAPAFSIGLISPPRTSSPMKGQHKAGRLFEKEMKESCWRVGEGAVWGDAPAYCGEFATTG